VHALQCIKTEILPRQVDLVVFLQATSPLRRKHDIDNAVALLVSCKYDSLFSARHVEGYCWRDNGSLHPPYSVRQRRQLQATRTLEENGSIYVFRPHVLTEHGSRLGGRIGVYMMHPLDSFQLDSPADIPLLEELCSVRG